jgi:hypothetical protein
LLVGTLAAGAFFSAPASACREPAAKDRAGYERVIGALFAAWWKRDLAAFRRPFEHPERGTRIDVRSLFDAHFDRPERRFRGEMLFNGETVVVQVVTPKEGDPVHGICGGYAAADLFLVRFFPGLQVPVVDAVRYLETNLLAGSEWTKEAQHPASEHRAGS